MTREAEERTGRHGLPFLLGAATLLILWLTLLWMNRRRIYLRI